MFMEYIFSRIFKKRELRKNMYRAKMSMFTVGTYIGIKSVDDIADHEKITLKSPLPTRMTYTDPIIFMILVRILAQILS